jgi:hypothetical protein
MRPYEIDFALEEVERKTMADRTFASNEEAFAFACEHLDCSLRDGRPVLGIVLGVQGHMCSVKVANREDRSIPQGSLSELLAQSELAHVCFSTMIADKVPQLQTGDLVLYTTMPELAAADKPMVAGTVTAKVTPHYTSRGTWQAFATVAKNAEEKSAGEAAPPDSTSTPEK